MLESKILEKKPSDGVYIFWSASFTKALRKCLEAFRDSQITIVSSKRGNGKTELMKIIDEGLSDAGNKIFKIEISGSMSSTELLLILGEQVNIHLGQGGKINLLQQFQEYFSTESGKSKTILIIDDCQNLKSQEFLGDLKFLADTIPSIHIFFFTQPQYLENFAKIFSCYEQRVEMINIDDFTEKESVDFVQWVCSEVLGEKFSLPDWTITLIHKLGSRNPGKLKVLTKIACEESSEHKGKFKEEHVQKRWDAFKDIYK